MLRLSFLSIIVIVALSSCTSYQYVTLNSDLPVDPKTKRYYQEKDDVRVTYEIGGRGMLVISRIYNESQEDLYVDLYSSLFIQNDKVVGTAMNDADLKIRSYSTSVNYGDFESTRTIASGNISRDPNVLYIPPGTYVEIYKRPFTVWYREDMTSGYDKRKEWNTNRRRYTARVYNFGEDAMKFGVSIRMAREEDFSDAWDVRANLFEDQLFDTHEEVPALPTEQAGSYMTMQKKGQGVVFGWLVIGGLFAILISTADGDAPDTQ